MELKTMKREGGPVSGGAGMHVIDDCLIVPVEGDFDDSAAMQLREEVLERTKGSSVRGVLIDVSTLRVLDSFTFSILADTARMISLLGAKTIFVGFQGGVASALIDLEVDLSGISGVLTMEDGLEEFRSRVVQGNRRDRSAEDSGETFFDDEVDRDAENERE